MHPSIFYANFFFKKLNGYNETFAIAGDLELNIRAHKYGPPASFDFPVSIFFANGVSSRETLRTLKESHQARQLSYKPESRHILWDVGLAGYQFFRALLGKLLKLARQPATNYATEDSQ
jgi:hypothetical protein